MDKPCDGCGCYFEHAEWCMYHPDNAKWASRMNPADIALYHQIKRLRESIENMWDQMRND